MYMSTAGYSDTSHGASEIVGSVDGEGEDERFVIADITADGAWISMSVDDAPSLPSSR
ncbi:hypothetical protein SAMN06269185_2341 [Natronoarchaeum philippinense]|uniref:Uncharacterized protein n=2 Tax=Natronoarchaeum philippinense TaxID=558529 RepID=A0A285P1F6_NATPI|nr:hypothetical protein SAMN06269185_2341 [Natronoarchaeum philippinense]